MQGCVPCCVLLVVLLGTSLVSGLNPFISQELGEGPAVGRGLTHILR